MMKSIILIGALIALVSFAAADVAEVEGVQPASEDPVQRIHVLNPGEKEYLSPNLIGVQNIAVTNLPVTIDFVNIIDAFREVVDGVRYEIVLNALNTTDNNTEIVCRLVVLEKPWLTTLWGDKVRLLRESNCTSDELKVSERDRKSIEEKYETNALFTGSRNELTADDMSKLEAQIISSSSPQLTRQRKTTTTTTTVKSSVIEQVTEPVVVTTPTDTQPEAGIRDDIVINAAAEESSIVSTEDSATTTSTEAIPELSDDEKRWLDDFLSIGAYNFETTLQNKKAKTSEVTAAVAAGNDETQQSDQDEDERARRGIAGGIQQLTPEELKVEQEALALSLSKLATGDGPSYTIVAVHSGTRQVVSGTLTKLDVDLRDGKTGEVIRCVVSLWAQPWLAQDGYEVRFECPNQPERVHRHSRSVEEREKRGIKGGIRQLDAQELKVEEAELVASLSKLSTGDGPSYTVVKVYSGTKQVVSGTITKLDVDLLDGKTGNTIRCIVSLWAQPWLPKDGYEVKFVCPNQPESVHRHSRSIPERKKRDIKSDVLDAQELKNEEAELVASLRKLSTGGGPSYTVLKVSFGTKHVVSGTLTKLYVNLLDDKTGNLISCIVSFLVQPWLRKDGYEIKFVCPNQPDRVYRHSRSIPERTRRGLAGGIRQLDAQELKLEEEALSKSLSTLATGDGPSYTIVKVHSGTKQVVSGSLTKLDVDLLDGKTGNTIRCKVSLWAQPWLKQDGYEVKFECPNQPESVHRHSRSVDEVAPRHKRSLVGAPRSLSADELKEEEVKISASLATLASGSDGPNYKIVKTFSGTRQIVAGTLVKADVLLRDENTGTEKNCTISRWSRPWIQVDGYEISFECDGEEKTTHRHSRSVEYAQKKSHKKNHRSLDKAEHLFQKFQNKFSKKYHSSMERQMRLRIFKHNLKLIQDLNKNEMGSAKYGITEFADMTTTEYRERTGLMPREDSNAVRSQAKIPDVELPKEFDWREKGVISQVKNQGNCGSCWAFSVTGNIEGLHAVKTGKLEEYSEQELLDCDTVDSACQGGLPDNAYQAIEKIGGLELESEYPYEAKKGRCHFNSTLSRVKISGAVDLPKNETQMAQWLLTNGPISIGINANAMQFYRGGVSHPWKVLCSKGNLDHGVLIVGYGVSEYPMFKKTLPYWIVKNSWGPKWGEQGYYRVYRGDNTCGVSEMATSAILA